MEHYVMRNGKVLSCETIVIPEEDNNIFKVNLPEKANFPNGEGIWACTTPKYLKLYQDDWGGERILVKILNDSLYYPRLTYGTVIPVVLEAGRRPVAIFEEISQY